MATVYKYGKRTFRTLNGLEMHLKCCNDLADRVVFLNGKWYWELNDALLHIAGVQKIDEPTRED